MGARRLVLGGTMALVVASFAFAPVRGFASEVLQVFRIQKVQTISLDQTDLERIGEALSSGGHVDLEDLGEAWVDGEQGPRDVTLAEAEAAVDFPVVLPAGLESTPTLMLQPAMTYRFKLNVEKVNESLRSIGATHLLPEAVDGKVFSVELSPILMAEYGPGTDRTRRGEDPDEAPVPGFLTVGQGRSPELVMPEGVSPLAIRDVLINLPFLPDDVRQRLASVTDWQHTLLVPNIDGTAKDIEIAGVPAVLLAPRGETGEGPDVSSVIWNRDGVVYGIGGDVSEEDALRLATSMIK